MESIKIILGCIVAAVLYGIVHDQFTARICIEYFTVFHPPVFATHSPTLLAFGWGTIATWWAGTIIGVLVRSAARTGSTNKLTARQVAPMVAWLMGAMAICAALSGIIGYLWGSLPEAVAASLPPAMDRRFLADWWAHTASYASGFLGGLVLCAVIIMRRREPSP